MVMMILHYKLQKWILFLSISFLINLFLLAFIHLDTNSNLSYNLPSIKVNLLSLAAPAIQSKSSAEKEIENESFKEKKLQKNPYMKVIEEPEAIKRVDKVKERSLEKSDYEKKETVAKNLNSLSKQKEQNIIEKASNNFSRPKVASLQPNLGKRISNTIHEAKYRMQIPPVYPRRAYELGQEGVVILLAQVSINGKPRMLEIEESSGYRLLDSAAMAAVKKWEFEPIKVNEQSIVSWVRVPVRFVIQ